MAGVATCSFGGIDLREWLVRKGMALDWPQYSRGRYEGAQRDAERWQPRLWKGSYVEPWRYRACIRANGRALRLFGRRECPFDELKCEVSIQSER
jgi:endonuclease YncB( thermonuclease family)